MFRRLIPLLGLLIAMIACQRTGIATIQPEETTTVRRIVVTATPTLTPVPTATPTLWLEEVRPTATPLPTPAPGEIRVMVIANEGAPITPLSWHFRNLIESSDSRKVTNNGGLVEMIFRGQCGDECGFTTTLTLQHMAGSPLPEFVAHSYVARDYYDGATQYQMLDGRLEIDEWDLDGVISGRIVRSDDDYRWPAFEFWHDFSAETLMGRHLAGRAISTDDLRTALQIGTPVEKRSAMFIIRQLRIRSTARMFDLVPDLIAAIADTTQFEDNEPGTSIHFIGRDATFTLSALASARDGTYFANRVPMLDYTFFDGSDPSAEIMPSQERIADIQANWKQLFDTLPDQ